MMDILAQGKRDKISNFSTFFVVVVLCVPSTVWMMSAHIREGDLLYTVS